MAEADPRDQQIEWLSKRLAEVELSLWRPGGESGSESEGSTEFSSMSPRGLRPSSAPGGGPYLGTTSPRFVGTWDADAHAQFLRALARYGSEDYEGIARELGKDVAEIRTYGEDYQNFMRHRRGDSPFPVRLPPQFLFFPERKRKDTSTVTSDSSDGCEDAPRVPKRSRSDEAIPGTGFFAATIPPKKSINQRSRSRRARKSVQADANPLSPRLSLSASAFPAIAEVDEEKDQAQARSDARSPRTLIPDTANTRGSGNGTTSSQLEIQTRAYEQMLAQYYTQLAVHQKLQAQLALQNQTVTRGGEKQRMRSLSAGANHLSSNLIPNMGGAGGSNSAGGAPPFSTVPSVPTIPISQQLEQIQVLLAQQQVLQRQQQEIQQERVRAGAANTNDLGIQGSWAGEQRQADASQEFLSATASDNFLHEFPRAPRPTDGALGQEGQFSQAVGFGEAGFKLPASNGSTGQVSAAIRFERSGLESPTLSLSEGAAANGHGFDPDRLSSQTFISAPDGSDQDHQGQGIGSTYDEFALDVVDMLQAPVHDADMVFP